MTETVKAHPPETTEGWYAFHQILAWNPAARRTVTAAAKEDALRELSTPVADGWTAVVPLIGSRADVMLIHFRATLDEIGVAQRAVAKLELFDALTTVYTFLSVTEAGLYHASAQLAADAVERGGTVGDDVYKAAMAARVDAERKSAHVHKRLYPRQPDDMPYTCFYPMSKRRAVGQNWYALSLEERSRLMMTHGMTGRGYAGRVSQVITGAIGLDAWEWGVTLFAGDPLSFKKIVTDMRFDEVSASYAEFGEFFVGRTAAVSDWIASV
jgi:chlorite dismutase